ncbi:bifunctional adenosylcobinamide kinase/adenosylcobinamide-phosphate guanylyltransferase [Anoxybacteroides tepidamans]|uniref:bifunctional adenosylcobinamide kinase/adenosylcobinamide-phosphate guanylyltransferase n=1 Tax=Anoxybacteroides tepidamans TaxID=265948 RepID=UPI000487FBE5|nr:bifunctional adenosylcobinamide kinase/adenosylcobinamide-phosphate guanylyltransferase [Anoxybacillus tepidamans]
MIVFISGGVRSGKSDVAERCVQVLASSESVVHYIATAKVTDEEMRARVVHHQKRRDGQSLSWQTWEQPLCLHKLAPKFAARDVVLLDCLTNWLANELFATEGWEREEHCLQIAERMLAAIKQLAASCKALIIVSNELFSGGVPDDIGTYHFMKALGRLHQRIVDMASSALLVQHGIPTLKKGVDIL